VREILKYKSVESVQLVDLDPMMTGLSDAFPPLAELNHHSFSDPRVSVTNGDAFVWLDSTETEPFDIAIVDFRIRNNFALGKLYSTRFYNLLKQKLKPDSAVVIQCTFAA
jgi:spermidine synthase